MGKLLFFAVLACLVCRLLFGRWPWQLAQIGTSRQQTSKQARTLLGVGPDATREDIVRAHKAMISQVHPDRGGSADQVHDADAARDLLLKRLPDKRRTKDPS
ncbi:MAG: molecular chaperone DnaJ [Pontixanthobacter sp.]